jgi:hypothetical protein
MASISSRLWIVADYDFLEIFRAQFVPTLLRRRFSNYHLQSGCKMHPMIQTCGLGMEISRGLL